MTLLRIFLVTCLGMILLVPSAVALSLEAESGDTDVSDDDLTAAADGMEQEGTTTADGLEETANGVAKTAHATIDGVEAPPPDLEKVLGGVAPTPESPVDLPSGPTIQSETRASDPIVEPETAAAVVVAAGGFGILFLLKSTLGLLAGRLVGLPLFSRINKDEILANEGREILITLVESNPGIGLMELSEMSGLGWGTTVYHMTRLQQAGLVASMKNGQNRHFFKNGHPAARSKKAVAVLKNETAGQVARFVMATPGVTQAEIGRRLAIGAPTVTKYVKRLESEGLLSTVQDGRTKLVHGTPELTEVMGHLEPVTTPNAVPVQGPMAIPA